MKKIFEIITNFFSKNGLIKILIAFILLIVAVIVIRNNANHIITNIFNWVGYISMGYIVLTITIFFISGIVNSIKDKLNK